VALPACRRGADLRVYRGFGLTINDLPSGAVEGSPRPASMWSAAGRL